MVDHPTLREETEHLNSIYLIQTRTQNFHCFIYFFCCDSMFIFGYCCFVFFYKKVPRVNALGLYR